MEEVRGHLVIPAVENNPNRVLVFCVNERCVYPVISEVKVAETNSQEKEKFRSILSFWVFLAYYRTPFVHRPQIVGASVPFGQHR
jgi:hypothetical protein